MKAWRSAICFAALGIWLGCAWGEVAERKLQFVTHDFPPMAFVEKDQVTGLCVDIVKELQLRSGMEASIELVPWARGYAKLTGVPNTALFFTTRTADRETLFQWVGPIVNVASSFYAKAGSTIAVSSVADASRVKTVIVHRGSFLEKALSALRFGNLLLVDSPEDGVRLLLMKKDNEALLLMTMAVVPSILNKRGLPADALKPVLQVHASQGYIALSPGTPSEWAGQLQLTLDQIKRDGSFARIYRKWLPNEKIPGLKGDPEVNLLQPPK